MTRTVNAGQAVTIGTPLLPKELRGVRVPVQVSPTDVQYVPDLQWVDTPDRLFQALLEETVRRTTNRVVLDPRQATLDPGLVVTGELERFGYDVRERAGDGGVRCVARQPPAAPAPKRAASPRVSPPTEPPVRRPGLNQAANQVATEVANWIGNSSS